MKAAVVTSPGILEVMSLSNPEPGPYEARCEMLYGAICAGTDSHLLHGRPPFSNWMKMPYILGHESIGRVTETGPKTRYLKKGDLITRVGAPEVDGIQPGWGGFAEIGIARDWRAMKEDGVDPREWESATVMQKLPADIDPAAATMFITWRETLSYITRMGVTDGCSVLVIGSGGNGLSFAAQSRNLGAKRIIMLGSQNREAQAKRAGVTDFINYRDESCMATAEQLIGDGVTFAIDAIGKAELAGQALRLLAVGGTMGIYGLDGAGEARLNPSTARGTFTVYGNGYDEAETHEKVVEFFQAGKLDASIWLNMDSPFPLSKINDAFKAVEQRAIVKPLIRLNG